MSQPLPRSRKLLPLASAVLTVILLVLAWGWIRFAPGRMHRLAESGDVNGLRLALRLGADPNATAWDRSGMYGGVRPLMAAVWSRDIHCVTLLLDAGSDVNAEDVLGHTALLYAVHDPRILRLLIERGADLNRCPKGTGGQARFHMSPVYVALREAGGESIRVFLSAGVDPQGECFRQGLYEGLVSRGASLDAVFVDFLEHARGRMDGMEAQYLLAAAEGGARESCRVLLDMEIAADSSGPSGKTPLMCAVRSGAVEVVELLLNRGANRALKDSTGKTALDYLEQAETRGLPPDRIELLRGMLAIGDGRG